MGGIGDVVEPHLGGKRRERSGDISMRDRVECSPFESRRAHQPGRKPAFDREIYRRRNVVERCVNRLKQWRGIATRYEKRADTYRAMVVIASLMIWLGQ